MPYLDYSRPPGNGCQNQFGGREKSRRHRGSWRPLQHRGFRPLSPSHDGAESSTARPQVSRPVEYGGLGFGLQMEYGLDARHADYITRDQIHRKLITRDICSGCTIVFGEFHPAACRMMRLSTQALDLDGCRRNEWQRFAICALLAFMFGHPAEIDVHGMRVPRRERDASRSLARLASPGTTGTRRHPDPDPRPEQALSHAPALHELDAIMPASSGL